MELRLANGKRVRVRGEIRGSVLSVKGKALRGRSIASVRLTHAGREEEPVRLHEFKLALPATDPARDPATLSDADCLVNGERGRRSSMMQLYPIEKGVRQLRLHAPAQKGKMVNEVIFRMKP